MKLTDILDEEAILPDVQATNKLEVLEVLTEAALQRVPHVDKQSVLNSLIEREKLGSTGIGEGIAIPHGKSRGLKETRAAFGRCLKGVDFEALDGQPVYLFFLLLVPDNSAGVHLKILARISRLFKNSEVRSALIQAKTKKEIYDIIAKEDAKY
ncbi:MAG TPA: PTS sugar transporter subunit IIA [Candidatus Limnocylindrales bacterium]|nr:PTS sugar transporter subunit IIA [Candidatus Limnocylindrales bacterium]